MIDGVRVPVESRYVLRPRPGRSGSFGFAVGAATAAIAS